jgi:hypothetical protein
MACTQTTHDDLTDVRLEGVSLVPDDPSTWKLPSGMGGGLWDYWNRLHDYDNALWARVGGDRARDELLELADTFADIWSDYQHSTERVRQLRRCVVAAAEHGLDLTQTARLFGTSREHLVLCLSTFQASEDAPAKVRAEEMLRAGHSVAEASRDTGLKPERITHLARQLSIKVPRRNRFGEAYPKEIRVRAVELANAGQPTKAILQMIEREFGRTVKPYTVRQWVHRANR